MKMKWFFGFFLFVLAAGFFFGLGVRKGTLAGEWIATPKAVLTEDPAYLEFCKKAAIDPTLFAGFKRDPIYTIYHENTSVDQAKICLGLVRERAPQFLNRNALNRIRSMDRVGGALCHNFPDVGKLSPTTAYYMKVASDIWSHFGDLKRARIVEIGGGSGGLCKVLCELFDVEHYTIIDLPETLEVTRLHLDALGLSHVELITGDDLRIQECDLVVSNYGFSQTSAWVQRQYLRKVFRYADRGYIVCGFYPKSMQIRPIKRKKLMKKIARVVPNYEQFPEEPQTSDKNFTLIWRKT